MYRTPNAPVQYKFQYILLLQKKLFALCMVSSVWITQIHFFQQLRVLKFLDIIELQKNIVCVQSLL